MDNRKYKVIQVFNRYLNLGGEQNSVERIRDHLRKRHDLNSCTFDSATWLGKNAPSIMKQALLIFYNGDSAAQLRRAIKNSYPDIILTHNIYPVGSPSLYRVALECDVPVIQYIHNFRPFSVGGTLWAKGRVCAESLQKDYWREVRLGAWQNSVVKSALMALVLKRLHATGWLNSVKGWIAISDFMRRKFITAGVEESKIFTLPHPWITKTDTDQLFPDDGYYLFLGRLVEEKGVRILLEAWNWLSRQGGSHVPELWIAGDGPLRHEVEIATTLNSSIKYLGFLGPGHKEHVISRCRAMLAPSTWWEPLGLVTYEAYDYKKPMFASKSGGLMETVTHEQTGFLHEPGDSGELAQQIVNYEGLPNTTREELGRQGRRWLEMNTSPQAWSKKFDEILHAVANH